MLAIYILEQIPHPVCGQMLFLLVKGIKVIKVLKVIRVSKVIKVMHLSIVILLKHNLIY